MEIAWETHEITTISFKLGVSETAFCQSCRLNMPHLRITEAAAFINISEAAVFRQAETSEIHYLETGADALLVCGNSLAAPAKE